MTSRAGTVPYPATITQADGTTSTVSCTATITLNGQGIVHSDVGSMRFRAHVTTGEIEQDRYHAVRLPMPPLPAAASDGFLQSLLRAELQGGSEMAKRIQVAYVSKHGATKAIAEKVGEVLRRSGLNVDLASSSGDARNAAGYDAVVFGCDVYYGS